jgi:hypothetical protein
MAEKMQQLHFYPLMGRCATLQLLLLGLDLCHDRSEQVC